MRSVLPVVSLSRLSSLFAVTLLAVAFQSPANAAVNHAPTISGTPPATAVVGQKYSFTPVANDADRNVLNFGVVNKPSWLSYSYGTGQIWGTPTKAGTWSNIQISVWDGKNGASTKKFSITVTAAAVKTNRAPTISGAPATSVAAGSTYSFKPTASDPDKDALGFSIKNLPSWASFSTATGQLSGTPGTASAGTYSNIVVSVSDGKLSTALAAFAIAVSAPANKAPQLSGTPVTALNANSAYSFKPVASDADGDTLTFSIANKPVWASFNTATGQLSGMPSAVNVGSYSNVVISASDGKTKVSLPAFSIAVNQISLGSAVLAWSPPTQNTDGSVLTDLAGYRIYYGTTPSAMTQTIQVSGGGMSTYVVENLAPATYYFAVRAYTNAGSESVNSNVASKVVQ
ncbi:MAG TPA: putative Ig domain-containing protein [Steroidobacteraceae bacterium]|jgi:hypothetical protein